MRLGNAASGHSAFPARSTGFERELSRVHVLLRCMSSQLAHLYGPAVRCKPDVTDLEMTGLAHLYSAL